MRLWIAMTLAAVGLAAGTWWLTRAPAPEQSSAAVSPEAVIAQSIPPPQPTGFSMPGKGRRFNIRPAANEPIRVYTYSRS